MSEDDLVREQQIVASNLDPRELNGLYLQVEEVCFSSDVAVQIQSCQGLWSPIENHLTNLRFGGMSYGEKVLEIHNSLFFAASYAAALRAVNSKLVNKIEQRFAMLPAPFQERLYSVRILDENVCPLQRLFRMAMRYAWIQMVSRAVFLPKAVLQAGKWTIETAPP